MSRRKTPVVENVYLRLGKRIAELRKQRGLTQEALGALAGVSPNYVARTEAGYHRASLAKISAIAEAVGVPLGSLFSEGTSPRRRTSRQVFGPC